MLSTSLLLAASMVVGQAEEAKPNVPTDVLEHFERLLGDWKVAGKANNEPVSGTFSVQWAPGGHMLTWTATWSGPEGNSVGSGIDGWDSAEKRIVATEFWSDGWCHDRRYKVVSPQQWESTEATGATGDGKRIKSKVRVMFNESNKFTLRTTSSIEGEEEPTEVFLTFEKR